MYCEYTLEKVVKFKVDAITLHDRGRFSVNVILWMERVNNLQMRQLSHLLSN